MEEYLRLAERSDTDVVLSKRKSPKRSGDQLATSQMHLFDLLRERQLFPSNTDLSEFAGRVLPNMSRKRFDKMSRSDIAARILEYLEKKDVRARKSLETSMREAMKTGTRGKVDRKSFQSEWEKIIKGIEL